MIREQVPFDDLFPGDWITVHYRDRLSRVRRSSGKFREFMFDTRHWVLIKTGNIWAIHTSRIVAVDLVRKATEASK